MMRQMRTFLLLTALAAPPALAPEPVCVMVVRDGTAPIGQVLQVRRDLRAALSARKVAVMDDSAAAELARLVSPAGECDADCETRMRGELPGASLLLVRLSAADEHFALRVSNGRSKISAAGRIDDLPAACVTVAAHLAGAPGAIYFDGDPGEEVFLDGKPIRARANASIVMPPGRYVLRFGDGTKPYSMARVEVRAGETIAVRVPAGLEARRATKPPATSVTGSRVANPPVPSATGTPAVRSSSLAIEAGLAFGMRERSVRSDDASLAGARFAGTGLLAEVGYERGAWIAGSRLEAISYRGSVARIAVPDGSTASVHGGDSLHVAVLAGRRIPLPRSASLDLLAGLDGSRHGSQDLRGPDGDAGAFPSHQRLGARIEAVAKVPLTRRASMSIAAAVLPWSAWSETPTRATGSRPRASPSPELRLGANRSFGAGSLGAEIGATWQRVDFEGSGSGSFGSELSNARVEESAQWITITLQRGF